MMRPQVRILTALLALTTLIATVRGKTFIPLVADASGNITVVQPPEEPAEKPSDTPADQPAQAADADPAMVEEDTQEQAATEGTKEAAETEAKESEGPDKSPLPPLSPEMAAFRDQVRRTLSQVYARSLSAQSSLPTEIIAFAEAFGHTAELSSGSRSGQKINAVGSLCWNYPCGGYRLLRSDGTNTVALVGYGHQQRPAQLLAALAQIRVRPTYEIRIGDHHGTVADLVASEKRDCRDGLDQSAALIALSFYSDPKETWQNDLGETWSVQRLLKAELDRTADPGRIDVINRLMGISFALKQAKDESSLPDDLRERAEKHIAEFHQYALGLQNSDGSWHPGFFAYRGPSKDTDGSIYSTGAIMTWLVSSLPVERLEDEPVVRGLSYLNKQLTSQVGRRRSSVPSSAIEAVGQMNAARALSLYDVRYLTPRTPKEPAEPETENPQARATSRQRTQARPASSNYSSRSTGRSSSSR